MEPTDLAPRARRAYELGRLRRAVRIAWTVLPLIALSAAGCGHPAVSLAVGAALLGVTVALRWRGQTYGGAVVPGLMAGLIPLVLLVALKLGAARTCALDGCMDRCVLFCWGGGFASGLLVALRARRLEDDAVPFVLAGGTVAALTGLLGCVVGGIGGAFGMLVAEAIAAIPVFAVQLRRSSL